MRRCTMRGRGRRLWRWTRGGWGGVAGWGEGGGGGRGGGGGGGAVIAHGPTANRLLEAGEMDQGRALGAGVSVSLGSDVAGGPDRSMVRVARGMIETGKQVRQ